MSYETPKIVDFGDLVELTAQQTNGEFLDAAFPEGTPKSQLTFSN